MRISVLDLFALRADMGRVAARLFGRDKNSRTRKGKLTNMDTYRDIPEWRPPSAEEIKRFLESIAFDRLTEGEVDELARIEEMRRSPHEI